MPLGVCRRLSAASVLLVAVTSIASLLAVLALRDRWRAA